MWKFWRTEWSLNRNKDHKAEHTVIRYDPCEFCDELKGAKNDMNDHMVSEHLVVLETTVKYNWKFW